MAKVLSNDEHNAKINEKIKELQAKIDELKADLKPISPVKQASLAECNALARNRADTLKPQAPAVKLKAPQAVPMQPGARAENTLDYTAE